MTGEDGPDTVFGAAGGDSFVRGDGKLIGLHGEEGQDTVRGGDRTDTLAGGNNDDALFGGADGEHDHCDGGDGFDTFENCHLHPPGSPGIPGNPFARAIEAQRR